MQIHGSIFVEGWPRGANTFNVRFYATEVGCTLALSDSPSGASLSYHLGYHEGNLERLHGQLLEAADALRLWIDKRSKTPAELAPAGVSEQDDEVPF